MAGKLNKKVLCFIDEHGTPGVGPLHLGGVLVLARDAGRVDKAFSDALECPSQTSSSQSTPMSSQSLGKLMEDFIHKLSQTPSQ